MAQTGSGRITCPRCGANNFETVTACWKCQTPLGAASVAAPMPGMPVAAMDRAPLPIAAPPSYAPSSLTAVSGDPAVARRAAFWLAVSLPYLGLPIGWAFMMVEDHRRQAIGRLCVIWSLIALIFHTLLMFVAMASLKPYLDVAMKTLANSAMKNGGSSGRGDDGLGGMNP